jgi:hypothetical protein
MIDIVFGVIVTALAIALLHLNRKIINIVKAYANLIMALQNLAQIAEEQQKVNIGQQSINDLIGQNLEILGVHTRLIEPTIAYEASAFLAWWNKKKEENK